MLNTKQTMKKIKLNKLALRNFKGAKNLEIEFSDLTTLEGDNGTGKTTVFDAFNFLLWGKNSVNESTFEIKTLSESNEPIHNLEHEVFGIIESDGETFELKRTYRENWIKKRGAENRVFDGHSTDLFVNDVPYSLSDYKQLIATIIPDEIARMITDPRYFNVHLKWNERRVILSQIAGEISNQSILDLNPDLDEIPNILNSGKSLTDKKKEIGSKKATIKKDLDVIPARVDEVERSIPEAQDWVKLESEISELQKHLDDRNATIESEQKRENDEFEKVKNVNTKRNSLKIDLENEKSNIVIESNKEKNKLEENKRSSEVSLKKLESELKSIETDLLGKNTALNKLRTDNVDLRKEYDKLNNTPIAVETDTICGTCKQDLQTETVESKKAEISKKANENRVIWLNKLADKGKENNVNIQRLQGEISTLKKQKEEKAKYIESADKYIKTLVIPEIKTSEKSKKQIDLELEIDNLTESLNERKPFDFTKLKQQKEGYESGIKTLEKELLNKELIERLTKRIEQLNNEQKTQSQEIARLERTEMQIDKFIKIRMEMVENRVNGLFELVKFKMFDKQINGGETPNCVCLVGGVPYSDLNTASKINAGLDIINTLQRHYEISAPVFIDNRESISEIVDMNCQIVNLVKVKGVNNLIVK